MSNSIFDGPEVNLIQVLTAREDRVRTQERLLDAYADHSLLCVNLNIPGPIKQSKKLIEVFDNLIYAIKEQIKDSLVAIERDDLDTGSVAYLVVHLPAEKLKRQMIALEEEHPYGRLADIDVLVLHRGNGAHHQLKSISRTDLGFPPRTCLLCQRPAKECGRSRRHSVDELTTKITALINEKGRHYDTTH